MLKKTIKLVLFLFVLLLLTACRVVWVDETLEQKKSPEVARGKETILLEATVQYNRNRLVIRGQTNLPEGAVIHSGVKQYPDGAEQLDVINGVIEPLDEYILEKTSETSEDGSFLIVLERPDTEKQYQLSVRFLPELQPAAIQNTYGKTGENIGSSEGVFKYEANGITSTGMALYSPIGSSLDGGFWYLGKYKMQANQKDAMPAR
ncbi:hypothetical protein [Bacillus sp. SG-1]|uniref:hypothetical protein n=1 Tax=Bacillus sp. SG-1 TaxID=161544 RepID=UPI0001544397|nr:hypothetical protein [Bacillus sp. SG-1]EDL65438.1 hypothetical protein BSG1_11211 [Bacillus sp. SG-1]